MSSISSNKLFVHNNLPPDDQLKLHVDPAELEKRINDPYKQLERQTDIALHWRSTGVEWDTQIHARMA